MSRENPSPAEREQMLKEVFPDIDSRLSRPGDPELSGVLINFYPKSEASKTSTPRKKSVRK